jgi:hypothetical protein
MTFLYLCLALGLLLAQRFKGLVLLPATLLVVALTGAIAGPEGPWLRALMGVLGAASLQFGYLCGLGLRSLYLSAVASRLRGALWRATRRTAH